MKELHVLLDGQHIGVLAEDDHGRHMFQYDADMGHGISMPVRGEAWSGRPVEAYIDGLLPDSMDVRTRIGNLYGVSPRNPFALLSVDGMDCGGAVQFITEEQLAGLPLPEVWEPRCTGNRRTIERDRRSSRLCVADERRTVVVEWLAGEDCARICRWSKTMVRGARGGRDYAHNQAGYLAAAGSGVQ